MKKNPDKWVPIFIGKSKIDRVRYLVFGAVIITCSFAIQSCKTSPVIAPIEEDGMMKADIGEGKVIYMRDCTRCHAQKKVEDFTNEQWSNILPRMVKKAQLDETKSRQVKAYVEWEMEND